MTNDKSPYLRLLVACASPGSVCGEFVYLQDLFPTFIEVAGRPVPAEPDTTSILGVSIAAEALSGASVDWYTFSTDGLSFSDTLTVGDLGPGEERMFHLKQEVPDNVAFGVTAARLVTTHTGLG